VASVFWDQKCVLLVDYLPQDATNIGKYYIDILTRLDAEIRAKRPHIKKKKIIFHNDNARPYICNVTNAKLEEFGYEIHPYPPHSPDLAPSDYHQFPDLKNSFIGRDLPVERTSRTSSMLILRTFRNRTIKRI
jgi:histone-lysine N-methyltransferase SETMAR